MKTLFLAWQDPHSRAWFPVGKLTSQNGIYRFVYLQGAVEAREKGNFQLLGSFPELYQTYTSTKLFPLFANRLLRSSRPDFADFVQWLNIPESQDDPIALLARSGGRRKTDSFEVFPCPEPDSSGSYHVHFFAHGLRHFPPEEQNFVRTLNANTRLAIVHDVQNQVDSRALILRTDDMHFVGYCPRYLTQDFFELVCKFPKRVKVTVERVNLPPTPLQFRLLCSLSADWAEDFQPFSGPSYQPIMQQDLSAVG